MCWSHWQTASSRSGHVFPQAPGRQGPLEVQLRVHVGRCEPSVLARLAYIEQFMHKQQQAG
eukprot:2479273-Prymnesium_polylepis.1